MAKYIVDGQKITNIANSIRNKKGVTTQFDIDEMPREIDSLSKGGAKIITNTIEGTQIPSTGYIEKIYFNINSSVEETEKILSQLTYSAVGSWWKFYDVVTTSETIVNGKKSIRIDQYLEDGIPVAYQIIEPDSEIVIYNSSTGWNKEYSFIEINDNIFSVGNQNDLLKNIISETSFVSKEIELEGTYDGSSVEITELKANTINIETYINNKQIPLEIKVPDNKVTVNSIAKGTAVPNSGYVEKVYFNKSLNINQITNILSSLTYYQTPFLDYPINPILFANDGSQIIFVAKSELDGKQLHTIYATTDITNPEKANVVLNTGLSNGELVIVRFDISEYEVNKSVINDYSGIPIGTENDKLINLFSITPFEGESVTLQGEYDGTPIEITENKVIDMKSYLDNKQLPLEVNVNVASSGGVDIPKVSNITLNGSILSWEAPDISELEQYKPIISYIVSVGENVLETTETSIDLISYLIDGTNTVSVTVKAILNGNSISEIIEYSKPQILDIITTMNATLPQAMFAMGSVAIDNKAYIFGGKGNGYQKIIQCYDSMSDTCIKMNATLSSMAMWNSAVTINNKAYIFGGNETYGYYNTIQCYDPMSDTITTMSATLVNKSGGTSAVTINNKAYIFGGRMYSSGTQYYYNTIQCYDPMSDTITTMNATLVNKIERASAVAIDNKAYIFGGTTNSAINTIQCYDSMSDTCIKMNATLVNKSSGTSAVNIYGKAYIFGGYTGIGFTNTIQCYDPMSDTITTMNATLVSERQGTSAVTINNKAYIFGGESKSSSELNTIQKFE